MKQYGRHGIEFMYYYILFTNMNFTFDILDLSMLCSDFILAA